MHLPWFLFLYSYYSHNSIGHGFIYFLGRILVFDYFLLRQKPMVMVILGGIYSFTVHNLLLFKVTGLLVKDNLTNIV